MTGYPKRFAILFLYMILLLTAPVVTSKAMQTQGPFAPLPVKLACDGNSADLSSLTDNRIKTVWKWEKETTLTIESTTEIGVIYIFWYDKQSPWTLTQTTNAVTGGTNGFLHEYITVPEPSRKLTLKLGDKDGRISDLFVFEKNKAPDWVQQWQPMLDKADLLLISAHADDEFLWFGGTLPVYAGEYKKRVQVAYLIHHGAARNAFARNHELLNGLWTVGIRNYPMISDFEDYYASSLQQALTLYKEADVLDYTVTLLRRFKPDVVVGHDPNGEYGHGVHTLSSYCLRKAVAISSDPSRYPETADQYGLWNIKKCYLHLYYENSVEMDWNVPLKAFGGKTGIEMARAGFACHISQQKPIYKVEGKGSPYDCQNFGLFYTSVGLDIQKNDFFEHIPPEPPDIPSPSYPTIAASSIHPEPSSAAKLSVYKILKPVMIQTPVKSSSSAVMSKSSQYKKRLFLSGVYAVSIVNLSVAVIVFLRFQSLKTISVGILSDNIDNWENNEKTP